MGLHQKTVQKELENISLISAQTPDPRIVCEGCYFSKCVGHTPADGTDAA